MDNMLHANGLYPIWAKVLGIAQKRFFLQSGSAGGKIAPCPFVRAQMAYSVLNLILIKCL
jgi:hypothetical protein